MPRSYGTGPYGTGRYGVGSGANFEVAEQTSITLLPQATPATVYVSEQALSSITLVPQAAAARIWSPGAKTGVMFSVQWRNPFVIHDVSAITQISFSVQGELVKTWDMPDQCFVPCEPGTWTQEFPPWTERMAA